MDLAETVKVKLAHQLDQLSSVKCLVIEENICLISTATDCHNC